MFKTIKYRLRPTKKQEKVLLAHIEECRLLYNQLVCARVQAWEKNKESLSRYEQQATLPMLKQQRKSFSLVYSQVLQQVCQRVDWAFKGFFRRLKERAKKGERARKVVARVHERIRNKRHNFVHQASRKIVNKYGFVAVEKLQVKAMQKHRGLSKSISDVAWSLFRYCLEYKAEEAGIGFKAVKPAYTSQACSACGYREKKTLAQRVHHCKKCGYTTDRDHNAAINILTLGLQSQVT